MLHDRKCYELAVWFLRDEPEIDNPKAREELAGAIQDAIEEQMASFRRKEEHDGSQA